MANIILVGFEKPEAEEIRDQIDALMEKHGWATEGESATIILDAETRWCGNKSPAPYLVVQHSKSVMAEAIGTVLHKALNLDTQIEVTYKYLASVTRMFFFRSGPCCLREVLPVDRHQEGFTEEGAEAIYSNADYVCVSVYAEKRNYWDVTPKNGKTCDSFQIGMSQANDNAKYVDLATNLEKRSGNKKLTIMIC